MTDLSYVPGHRFGVPSRSNAAEPSYVPRSDEVITRRKDT